MKPRTLLPLSVAVAVVGATLLLLAPDARAQTPTADQNIQPPKRGDVALKIEPGLAVPLTQPQSQLFKVGVGETIKVMFVLNKYLDVGPSATFLFLPAKTASPAEGGTAWTAGGSLRVKRPQNAPDNDSFYGVSPWADIDALYVRTDGLDRPGFAVAAGLSAPVGESRAFWIGPFVRYMQIMQPNHSGFNNDDAKILSLGISLEVGAGVKRPVAPVVTPSPIVRTNTVVVTKEVVSCLDRDKDGLPDSADRCPDVAGPIENSGCPVYKKLVVTKTKLELKEKIFFAYDKAILQDVSFPVLDEVVLALNDNKSFKVAVEGHTSSEGGVEHNQTLSSGRAEAVLDYLVAHGIAKDRLTSKGFASTVPIDSNKTVAGRENNRRVEFTVQFSILNDGSKQP